MPITKTTTAFGFALLALIATGVAYFGWQAYEASHPPICQVCQRPVHSHNRTIAVTDGRNAETFCCPTCAVNDARQHQQPLEIVELTDFVTGDALDPDEAFLVRGSDVNPCMEEHTLMDHDRQAIPMEFDRCAPSILAFHDASTAEAFVRQHGGESLRTADIENP